MNPRVHFESDGFRRWDLLIHTSRRLGKSQRLVVLDVIDDVTLTLSGKWYYVAVGVIVGWVRRLKYLFKKTNPRGAQPPHTGVE